MNRAASIFGVTLLVWLAVGWQVFDVNLAPWKTITLHWPRPVNSTAWFRWSSAPRVTQGQVIITSTDSASFKLTLPRGFADGQIEIQPVTSSGSMLISSTLTSGQSIKSAVSPGGQTAIMPVKWPALSTRGHTFVFRVTSTGSAVIIKSISVKLSRP